MVAKLPTFRRVLILLAALFLAFSPVSLTRADIDKEIEEVTSELEKQKQELSDLEKRKNQLAEDITSSSTSFYQVSQELSQAEEDLDKIEKRLSQKEEELKQEEKDRNLLIRDLYKQSRSSQVEVFLSSDNLIDSTKNLQYFDENLRVLVDRISSLSKDIKTFKANKAKAKEIRDELASLKNQYASSLYSVQASYSSVSNRISDVTRHIKNLSEKQKQLIAEKFGAISTSVGDVPSPQDPKLSVTYNPGFSPAFAAFSFGIPHWSGMSQYGAYGRAKEGQGYKGILKEYYKDVSVTKNYNSASKIHVVGESERNCPAGYIDKWVDLEDYLKGIWEMPRSWPMEALKAQAVAARTYALHRTNNGSGTIPPNQGGQVYCPLDKKSSSSDSRWFAAVRDTKGEVILQGGSLIGAYYASTAGGYTRRSCDVGLPYFNPNYCTPWTKLLNDRPNKSSNLDTATWLRSAYDGVDYGNSPYFYAAWYWARDKNTGEKLISPQFPHPWLNNTYMRDIVNSVLLYRKDKSLIKHLSAPDWDVSGTWGFSRVRNELSSRGGTHVSSISSVVTIVDKGIGKTTEVKFIVDGGRTVSVSGLDFLAVFNVRAPGYVHIKTPYEYPLFVIERK